MSWSVRYTAMVMRGFSLLFSLWTVAQRYTGSFSAAYPVWGVVQPVMSSLILLSAVAIAGMSIFKSYRTRRLPKETGLLMGALLGMELLWRLWIYDMPGQGFKVVSIAIYLAQPLVTALGIAGVVLTGRALVDARR